MLYLLPSVIIIVVHNPLSLSLTLNVALTVVRGVVKLLMFRVTAGGQLWCMYNTESGGVSYTMLYNQDSTTDESTTYRFVCMVGSQCNVKSQVNFDRATYETFVINKITYFIITITFICMQIFLVSNISQSTENIQVYLHIIILR